MSRGRYLLVDGHSIIFAWPFLREIHNKNQAVARETLVSRLQHFQDYTEVRVVVVFDGSGRNCTIENAPENIQVIFSDKVKTADDIIERLCAKYCATCEITVATADSLERQTAISFGAHCIDPEGLFDLVESAERSLESELRKLRKGSVNQFKGLI